MAELNWKMSAQASVEAEVEVAIFACEAIAQEQNVELYWVVEQFIKEFCRRAKDG